MKVQKVLKFVECNICKQHFVNLEEFDEHWRKTHLTEYGWNSQYPKIVVENNNKKKRKVKTKRCLQEQHVANVAKA